MLASQLLAQIKLNSIEPTRSIINTEDNTLILMFPLDESEETINEAIAVGGQYNFNGDVTMNRFKWVTFHEREKN